MPYDDPNSTVRHEITPGIVAGAASATMAKFHRFQKSRLKGVHGTVGTAGTAVGAGFDVYVGTSSVAAVTVGTNTAGSTFTTGALSVDVPANTVIELRGKALSATMAVIPAIELETYHDAVKS